MHPRDRANEILRKFDRQLTFLSAELPIDCECVDHIGPHQVHLSRTILLSNFKILFDHLEHCTLNESNSILINAIFDVFDAEMMRQIDLMSELPLLASRHWSRGIRRV